MSMRTRDKLWVWIPTLLAVLLPAVVVLAGADDGGSGLDTIGGAAGVGGGFISLATGVIVNAMVKRWRADRQEAKEERQAAQDERETARKSYEKLVTKIVDDRLNRLEESVNGLSEAVRLCAACRAKSGDDE